MIMERWRVGSLTMGLVLILFGIVTLTSLIAGFSAVNILLTLWPVILICLGVEILLHLFIRKKGREEIKLRYDILSILFIGTLLLISSVFYAFTYVSELYGSRDALAEALGIRNDTVNSEYSREFHGAGELVVFSDWHGKISVIPSQGDVIKVDYNITVRTSDAEYARSLMDGMVSFETGENAYMLVDTNKFDGSGKFSWLRLHCVVHLPEGKTLDLSQYRGTVEHDRHTEGQIIFYYENP